MTNHAFAILAADNPVDHVVNHKLWVHEGTGIWLWSGNFANLLLSGAITILVLMWVAKRVQTGPDSEGHDRYITKNPFAHMIEVICTYLRDEMVRPLLLDRTDKMMPFLWTLFFFILVNNMLGLVPLLDLQHLHPYLKEKGLVIVGGTATQNLSVTLALGIIAGIAINVAAIKRLGLGGYLEHQTGGAPWYVWPIVFPIELAGNLLIKPVALAVRLFANMTAGHILLAVLIGFVLKVWGTGFMIQGPVSILAVAGATAIYFLEIFVGFLQAFIFMFLTTVFIALLDHDHDEHHEHDGEHAAAH